MIIVCRASSSHFFISVSFRVGLFFTWFLSLFAQFASRMTLSKSQDARARNTHKHIAPNGKKFYLYLMASMLLYRCVRLCTSCSIESRKVDTKVKRSRKKLKNTLWIIYFVIISKRMKEIFVPHPTALSLCRWHFHWEMQWNLWRQRTAHADVCWTKNKHQLYNKL